VSERVERIVCAAPNPERYDCGHVVIFGTTVLDRRAWTGRATRRRGDCLGCRKLAAWVRLSAPPTEGLATEEVTP